MGAVRPAAQRGKRPRGAILNRHTITVAAGWLALTAIGEALIFAWDFFPVAASEEAGVVDDAFLLLVALAIPVLAFVVATLVYSVIRWRHSGDQLEDGPPSRTNGRWVAFWFAWTTALTVAIIVHPGFTGLNELRAAETEEPDLVVEVVGQQWVWLFEYPDHGVSTVNELVLPVDRLVRFNVTARDSDVLHSFWIPAFRVKIDAVPGLVTHAATTPTSTGTFDDDVNFRVQCAELCGFGHAGMAARVRVVEEAEFDAWVAEKAG